MFYCGVSGYNAADAARRAGYSENTAKEIGYENLTKPHIRASVDAELLRLANDHEATRARVLAEYGKIAFNTLPNVADFNGLIVSAEDAKSLPPEVTACIKSIKMTPNGVVIELHDKIGALNSLARCMGMFKDNFIVGGAFEEAVRAFEEAQKRKALENKS